MKTILLLLFTALSFICYADEKPADPPYERLKSDIDFKMEQLNQQLKEVRRDQLNYEIEKNLLKETYINFIEILNMIGAGAIGLFTVLSFLGMKNVSALRDDFKRELSELQSLKSESEKRLDEIETKQIDALARLEEVASSSSNNDQRLKVLEIIEKVNGLITNSNIEHALEYVNVALEIESSNITLLSLKDHCLVRLKDFKKAMEIEERMLEVDVEDKSSASLNLCELCIFTGCIDRYHELRDRYAAKLSSKPYLSWCLTAFEYFVNKEDLKLTQHIEQLVNDLPPHKSKKMSWSFEEAEYFIRAAPKREVTQLLLNAISALTGNLEPSKIIPPSSEPQA